MREKNIRKTLNLLINDESASDNEREQARRALKNLNKKGLVTVEMNTALSDSELVAVSEALQCVVTSADGLTLLTGDKSAVKAVQAVLDVCGGFPGQGVAYAVAIGVAPHVKVEKRAIIDSEYKVKRVRTKRQDIDSSGIAETLAGLVLERIREIDE